MNADAAHAEAVDTEPSDTESPDIASRDRRGFYIAIEGRDGTGKTVQVPRVADRLRALLHVDVRETREPGATRLGLTLRELLLAERELAAVAAGEDPAAADPPLSERARLLLFAADNAQHAQEIVVPTLKTGAWVLTDRSLGSALAYQGYGFGFGAPTVNRIYRWALDGAVPDLTVMLDCDDDIVAERIARNGPLDRIERLPGDFHARVRDGYRHIAATDRAWVTVDASKPIPEVTEAIVGSVIQWHAERSAVRRADPWRW